jgi:Pyruvate/2-oxoacid:ferredoxin oxidoreductase delta subunit
MTDSPYEKLREFLDQFPVGFPETSSGVEIKILKRLFTEEEARLAVLLPLLPETADQIAELNGLDKEGLEEKLYAMSKKGLIFRVKREGKALFRATPFMIGLYEYSVSKVDKELAVLYKEYYDIAYLNEMGASNIPTFKVMPISETLSVDKTILPFPKVEEDIKKARKIAVAECVCRKESRLTGKDCDHPIETCFSFGSAAEYYIENGLGREITADEAIKILYEADESGLIHAGVNVKHLSNICNCCPCCCASMKGITTRGHDKHKYLNALFEAMVDEGKCIGCENCVERCPVEAIKLEGSAEVNREKCLGCGLCASVCDSEAISLLLREDREEPFDRVIEMGLAVLEGKRKRRELD